LIKENLKPSQSNQSSLSMSSSRLLNEKGSLNSAQGILDTDDE